MNAAQARTAWLIARDELHAIQTAIHQIHGMHFRPAPLLSGLLPEAQRRVDETYGTMVRIRDQEDEQQWQELLERTRHFVPPDDNPLWTMDLCAAPVVKRRGRPAKQEVAQ